MNTQMNIRPVDFVRPTSVESKSLFVLLRCDSHADAGQHRSSETGGKPTRLFLLVDGTHVRESLEKYTD